VNILIIHEVSYLAKVVFEFQEFAELLAQKGHRVTVLDFDTNRAAGSGEDVSRTGKAKIALRHIPFFNIYGLTIISAKLKFGGFLKKILQTRKIDAVFLYSVFVNGTNTVKICRKRGIPVVYRCIDIYHKIRGKKLQGFLLRRGEKYIYGNANAVVTLNDGLKDYVRSMTTSRGTDNLTVLNPGVDIDRFLPTHKDEALMRELQIDGSCKVVIFLGTLYDFCGIDTVIDSLAKSNCFSKNVVLLLVGEGPLSGKISEQIGRLGLTKQVVSIGFKPFSDMPRYINCADLAIVPFEINDITRSIIPTKLFQYLACGKPVLCTPLPGTVPMLPEEKSGVVYKDIRDGKAFGAEIERLLYDERRLGVLGSNARSYMMRNYSWSSSIDSLEKVFTCLSKNGEQK
jgi:glycosyltransferase involved in cell wall biosynthesis